MKKFILSALATIIAISSFAQKKGEVTFEGTVGLSIIPSTSNISDNGTIVEQGRQTFTFGMDVELGAGIFFADKWKFAGTLGFDLVNNSSTIFGIRPSISYYVPVIADFYYVPSFDMVFGFGNRILTEAGDISQKYGCFDFQTSLNLISFEYRLTSSCGLGIKAGRIGYAHENLKMDSRSISTNTFILDINSARLSIIYYL